MLSQGKALEQWLKSHDETDKPSLIPPIMSGPIGRFLAVMGFVYFAIGCVLAVILDQALWLLIGIFLLLLGLYFIAFPLGGALLFVTTVVIGAAAFLVGFLVLVIVRRGDMDEVLYALWSFLHEKMGRDREEIEKTAGSSKTKAQAAALPDKILYL